MKDDGWFSIIIQALLCLKTIGRFEPGQDNDLNDVVFEYDLKVTECQAENGSKLVRDIKKD